jgi:hypothetical protein
MRPYKHGATVSSLTHQTVTATQMRGVLDFQLQQRTRANDGTGVRRAAALIARLDGGATYFLFGGTVYEVIDAPIVAAGAPAAS